VIPPSTGRRLAERIGREPPQIVEGASHFLQEDAGPEIGRRIADWLASG
jgi:haloalkane dehalogenase